MKKNITISEASVTSDATPTQAATRDESPCMSLQVTPSGIVVPDDLDIANLHQPFTPQDDQDLQRCEEVIRKNKKSFEATCAALDEIWSKGLYRRDYKSFKEYCEKKWNFSRSYGYRLLKAHKTINKVSTMVDTSGVITSGTQAMELAKVPDEKQADVIKAAKKNAGNAKMTSRHIKEVAQETKAKETVKPAKDESPANVTIKPAPANIISPAEFCPKAKILTMAELSAIADTLFNIYDNPGRRTEAGTLLRKLKDHLRLYAESEKRHLAKVEQKEAA